jgi:CRP-like cAMP-binding protein
MARRRKSPVTTDNIEAQMCDIHLRLSILQKVPFFAHLPQHEIATINEHFRESGYIAGESIYFSGDEASQLYVVASGQIKLLRHSLIGQDVLVDILSPGEFFGTLSTSEGKTFADTAQAQTAACVLSIASHDFRGLLVSYPSVALSVLDITDQRLAEAHEMLRQLSAHSVEQRIAYILLKLADKLGEKQDVGLLIQMPLTRDDIARMSGTSTETASRIMSQLQKDGLIQSGRQWVAIVKRQQLVQIAEAENQ